MSSSSGHPTPAPSHSEPLHKLSDVAKFDFYLPLCYHIPNFERGLEMTGKLQDGAIEESLSVPARGREDYFAYYYAYATASGKLLHAPRTTQP